jgi:hypothetical protein
LLIKQAGDHAIFILIEVDAQCDCSSVDARLHFATEERLSGVLPTAVISDQRHGPADRVTARIDPEIMQQLKRWQGGNPGLALILAGILKAAC